MSSTPSLNAANLTQSFLRLRLGLRPRPRCGDCGYDKRLTFSCSRHGFCPSCGCRRMSQMVANLIDRAMQHVLGRQSVLFSPVALRLLLAVQPKLVTPVLQVVQREVARHLLDGDGLTVNEGQGGAAKMLQRFGSATSPKPDRPRAWSSSTATPTRRTRRRVRRAWR